MFIYVFYHDVKHNIYISTVNICYIAPSHQFLKSVLSFFKPQINFKKNKDISNTTLHYPKFWLQLTYIYIYLYIYNIYIYMYIYIYSAFFSSQRESRFPWTSTKHSITGLDCSCAVQQLCFHPFCVPIISSHGTSKWPSLTALNARKLWYGQLSTIRDNEQTSVSSVSTIKRFQMSVY